MRKMASVQVVREITPIEGADSIELAKVLGWNVVVKKGEFKQGERVVFCEVDSLLPENAEYEFLRKSSYRAPIMANGTEIQRGGFKIKTIKLRGQVSQGLVLPVSVLGDKQCYVGEDVSEELGIIKYESAASLGLISGGPGRSKGPFPSFFSKTDEDRIQARPELLDVFGSSGTVVTEKLDGTSMTAFLINGQFGLCSRNLWLDETDAGHQIVRYAQEHRLHETLAGLSWTLGFEVCVQGELIGPGIQSNKYGLKQHEFRVFNLIRSSGNEKIDPRLAGSHFSVVPPLEPIDIGSLGGDKVSALVELSRGKSLLNPSTHREGIVVRSAKNQSLSFKVINPDFLLKNDD